MSVKGIDISTWQGTLSLDNYKNIVKDDVNFAILRCGFTSYGKTKGKKIDNQFENNYMMCKAVDLPVGVYYYSCATTIEEAKEEALFVLSLIQDKELEYPVYYDIEDNHDVKNTNNAPVNQAMIGKNLLTEIIKTFCQIVEEAGYYVGIYASTNWFNNYMNLSDLSEYDKWVAQWSESKPTISCGMWQYSSTGSVSGIKGNVDLNYAFINYENIIKSNGLNNFDVIIEEEPSDIPTVPEVEDDNLVSEDSDSVENSENQTDDEFLDDENVDNTVDSDDIEELVKPVFAALMDKILDYIKSYIKKILNFFNKR